jgi:cell division septum initiation protein DivIVA
VELSGKDIRSAAFDALADGGWDPGQVQSFLDTVADRIEILERSSAEAEELRATTLVLLEQAEDLVEQAKARAEASDGLDQDHAASLVVAAEARAQEIEATALERSREGEAEAAAMREQGGADAAVIVANARREAKALLEKAESEAAGPILAKFAAATHQSESLRREAEREVELARLTAATIVAEAEAEAARLAGVAAAGLDESEGKAEVGRIVAEAEALLAEARTNAHRIIADAAAEAAQFKTRRDLHHEIKRSIEAVQAVTGARTSAGSADAIGEVRGRAVQMLAELRRTEGRLAPAARADMLDELFEVQDIVKRIETRLIGREVADNGDELVVDLTEATVSDDEGSMPQRRSRYQQRSANLPKIGSDVEDVSRAVRSIRSHLHDRDDRE